MEPWFQEARLQTAGLNVLNGIELGTSVDLAADGEMALMGAPKTASGAFRSTSDMSAPGAGGFLAYPFASTFWSDPWFLNEATQTAGAELGTTLALNRDGGLLAIAASPFLQVGGVANVGSVVTYVFSSGSWNRVNSVASPAVELDTRFGHALALTSSGDRLVVGVWRDDVGATGASPRRQDGGVVANVGGAYVFVRTGNTFVLEASLKPATAAPGQLFGRAVSINARGDFVAIGAPGAQQVSFFSRASTTWTPAMTLTEPTVAAGSEFGASVSLSGTGNVLVVGAPAEGRAGLGVDPTSTASRTGSGAAFVYARQPVTFVRKAYLKPTWGSARFGASVRVAFVCRDSGPRWVVDAALKASLPTAGAEFGRSVGVTVERGLRISVWASSPRVSRSSSSSVEPIGPLDLHETSSAGAAGARPLRKPCSVHCSRTPGARP